MKYKKINFQLLRFLPVVFLALGMTSCLKSGVNNLDSSGISSVVEFGDISYPESFGTDPLCYDNNGMTFTNDTSSINIMVDYAGPVLDVPTAITVNLAYDTSAVSAYNSEEGLSYVQVPASAVTFPASVTIPAGQHLAYAHVVINNAALSGSTDYAIGFLITSVSSGVLSGNHADAVYEFSY